jgi:ribonuclease-3
MPSVSARPLPQTLFEQALTHRSLGAHNNERLEFLGDALVNLIVAEMLFERFPQCDEGAMTRMRASLVREPSLAALARQLGLGDRLKLGPGELKSGGHRRDSILADALEAMAAAYFLEEGWAAARERLRDWFDPILTDIGPEHFSKDGKTRLQEWMQARSLGLPEYQLLESTGPDHAKTFRASCSVALLERSATAEGANRKLAETRAAEAMLAQLENEGRTLPEQGKTV